MKGGVSGLCLLWKAGLLLCWEQAQLAFLLVSELHTTLEKIGYGRFVELDSQSFKCNHVSGHHFYLV